jgi:meckelin
VLNLQAGPIPWRNIPSTGAQCDTCAEGHVASSLPRTSCVPCPKYTSTDDCTCTGGVRTGGVCFSQTADTQILSQLQPESSSQSTVKYASGETIDSFYIRSNLRASYVLCQRGNVSACQLLANLCVLVNFAKAAGTEGPCVLYDRLRQGGTAVGPASNRYTLTALPQLYATDSSAMLIRNRIPTSYTTERGHMNSRLRLRLAEYALNGSFLGWVDPAPGGNRKEETRQDNILRRHTAIVRERSEHPNTSLHIRHVLHAHLSTTTRTIVAYK